MNMETVKNPEGILSRLTAAVSDGDRLSELLKHPQDIPPWAFKVPPCFNAALDLHKTDRVLSPKSKPVRIWTQGKMFCFEAGDVIYQNKTTPKNCIQVRESAAVTSKDLGHVEFELFEIESGRFASLGNYFSNQFDFVKLLITGDMKAAQSKGEK